MMENKQTNTVLDTTFDNDEFEAMKQKIVAKVKGEVDDLESSIGSIHYNLRRLQNQLIADSTKLDERKKEYERVSNLSLETLLAPVAKESEDTAEA
jgi:hypothetical protein